MEEINICLECDYEWEENNAISCRKCGSGDFYIEGGTNEK